MLSAVRGRALSWAARPAVIAIGNRLGSGTFRILTYHRVNDERHPLFPAVSVDRFAWEMEALARYFRVLSLTELLARADAGSLPAGAVAITFDDGYRDNYLHAYPVLRRQGLTATIFLTTGVLERRLGLWHDRVFDAFRDTGVPSIEWHGESLDLGHKTRRASMRQVLQRFKRMPPGPREEGLATLESALEVESPAVDGRHILRWDDVREMAAGGIEFGAHTVTHTILTNLQEDQIRAELEESKGTIEREIDRRVAHFAYPNGGVGDFDDTAKRLVRECGFDCALSTVWGVNRADTDRYALRRLGLVGDDPREAALRMAFDRKGR